MASVDSGLHSGDAQSDQTDCRAVVPSTKVLMLGALGVVYGDIGTSPIYAFQSGSNIPSTNRVMGDSTKKKNTG